MRKKVGIVSIRNSESPLIPIEERWNKTVKPLGMIKASYCCCDSDSSPGLIKMKSNEETYCILKSNTSTSALVTEDKNKS